MLAIRYASKCYVAHLKKVELTYVINTGTILFLESAR